MNNFTVDDRDIEFDAASRTLLVTIQPLAPDYSEADLIAGGWATMNSLELQRLVVTIESPATDYSVRN